MTRDLTVPEDIPGQLPIPSSALRSQFGPAVITSADAGDLPLPDATVDLIVTSPPYFGLRSYTDNGEHYAEQIGDEATPAEYLDALIACTAEWMRVLKPGGSIFVNLGDKYSTGNSGQSGMAQLGEQYRGGGHTQEKAKVRTGRVQGMAPKSLIGLPWRYAIRCIDELGLILRAEIVWAKPNGLPESVTDRVRRSHEQVFHFVKQPRYYAAVDEIRDSHAPDSVRIQNQARLRNTPATRYHETGNYAPTDKTGFGAGLRELNPLGKLPGSVWSIPTAPLRVPDWLEVDHFAAYPPELVRRIVLGWSPRGVCSDCGEGRRPVSVGTAVPHWKGGTKGARNDSRDRETEPRTNTVRTITGYACACPDTTAPTTPGVVLDPFGGTGTTALVASVHGRVGISNDLSDDYCRLARWRTTDPGERARVLDVPKPEPVAQEQLGLFEGLT